MSKPHLRLADGHWICTHDRTERHFLRGYWGNTPMQAYQNFQFHLHLDQVKFFWSGGVGQPA